MVAGHRDVCYSNLALMPAPQFYAIVPGILNEHDALCLLASRLQNHVVALGFLYGQQLDLGLRGVDDHGQLGLAHLALEFLIIEVSGATDCLFLHLDLNPVLQALDVHCPTRPSAPARVE